MIDPGFALLRSRESTFWAERRGEGRDVVGLGPIKPRNGACR